MASPDLAKAVLEHPADYPIQIHDQTLDFSDSYLGSINSFLNIAMDRSILRRTTQLRVFKEIKQRAPGSNEIFKQAFSLIDQWHPWQRNVFHCMVKSIIPLCVQDGKIFENGHSFSDHHFIGAIFASVDPNSPFPDLTLNIAFAHETAHQALMIYQHSGDLLLGTEQHVYSGVRKTLRPAISALHAAAALAYMIECIQAVRGRTKNIERKAFLTAVLSDYIDSLITGLKALEPLNKSDLCKSIIEDLRLVI